MASGMAVNSEARLWGPFKELEQTVVAAIHKKYPDAVHDLEVALKKHKPNFISLLKNPPKNPVYRDAVQKSTTVGIPVQGEQATQTFSQQFIEEALILSDLFDMSEIAAVELLMAGERKQAEFPGLSRGLVAVLLYYDGQKTLVNALRILLQSREGRMWTMDLSPDLASLVNSYTDVLIQQNGLVNKILDLISTMNWIKELDKLQKDRAIGPPKHRKQVTDLYREIRIILADCLLCLASQQPLDKDDTLRLIDYLKKDNSVSADGTLDLVTFCLMMTLLYCFDVSILEEDDDEKTQKLPIMKDQSYIVSVHREMSSDSPWDKEGLKAIAQLAWGLTLRQLSQYYTSAGVTDICEEDELIINMALESNVFHFLQQSVVSVADFHEEDSYLRRIHGLITDFIFHMPLKVKELRTRGEETAKIVMSQSQEGLDVYTSPNRGFEYLLALISDLYKKDPHGLGLSLEYWCPQEGTHLHESVYHIRPPQRQVSLYKFVRLAGDLLPATLYVPYIEMLTGLSTNPQASHHCFDLLKINGLGSGGPASTVSWNHIFSSLQQYYSCLRREAPTSMDPSHAAHRVAHVRGITPQELDGLVSVLKLITCIADQNENCRVALCENQQWSAVMLMFGLVTCSVPPQLKSELFHALAAFTKTPDIAASLWQTLESSQILPTVPTGTMFQIGGIQVELEEVEARNEEYTMTRSFLSLLNTMTDIPVPAGLGAGLRAPGFQPYLDFIKNDVFLKFYARAYKTPGEKWEVAKVTLEIMCKLLYEHEVKLEDFVDEFVEVQGSGVVPANKSPGHILLVEMLTDSRFLRLILRILDDTIKQFESYSAIQGRASLEQASLLCMQMIQYTLEKSEQFIDTVRETGASIMVSTMDRLLLGINPRSGKADHLVNISKFIQFNMSLPEHALSAMKILYKVCRSASVQSALVNLFTADQTTRLELLHGFVECLEVDDPEELQDRTIYLPEEKVDDDSEGQVRNLTRQHLIQVLLHSLDQPAPNLAHFLLGFELRKPVSKTNLQDPGILGSPKTCLHAILTILDKGVGTPTGPICLHETPKLAELSYKLIYLLAANKDTSITTLRYLRTTRDFLYRHLQHLPFRKQLYSHPVSNHQSWLMKVIAIELRITALNTQRSHTKRVMRLLLDDGSEETTGLHMGGEDTDTVFDRFGDSSIFHSTFMSQSNKPIRGKQTRRKLLQLLDTVDFTQDYPKPLQLASFEPQLVEQLVKANEVKTEEGYLYCKVRNLHRILLNELNNYHGSILAAQRPRLMEEIENIIVNVFTRNQVRMKFFMKQQLFDAWRQVTEIMLTACPEDLLPPEGRQAILFELLQELLAKVSGEDALRELTAPVAGMVLTLTANLRLCFTAESSHAEDRTTTYTSLLDKTPALGQTVSWGHSSGSRTQFASSLQLVLKGLIDYIMQSSGGQQKVRANLYGALLYYLQIAQKPSFPVPVDLEVEGVGKRLLADTDSEYEQLSKENVSTILSYGDNFMDTLCRDACDGHDVGRMLALSVLDMILSMDKFQQWLTFMSTKGYLQHLVDSLLHDDEQLQTLMSPHPDLKVLYIFESKMGLLTRVAESTVGAHTLLQCGIMQRLAGCTFLDLRPEMEGSHGNDTLSGDDFIPSPMVRYRHLLFTSLKLSLAILTSLGIENQDAGNQVLQFVFAHGEIFHNILRDRQPPLNIHALKELALTTAVIARVNSKDMEYNDLDPAGIEFRGHKARIERQMIALFPKYCLSDKVNKQLKIMETDKQAEGKDLKAELSVTYHEIASNVTSYCRALITNSGHSAKYCRVLFRPNLEEANVKDLRSSEEFSLTSLNPVQSPNLGVVVYQLRQCANHFMSVYHSHQQHLQKLQSLPDLSTDDLKEFSGADEKNSSHLHLRQKLAKKRLTEIVKYKGRELQHFAYIIENCLFILWRHLEFYLRYCEPVRQQPTFQVQVRRKQQMRRLQELTGAVHAELEDEEGSFLSDMDEFNQGVSKQELDTLKQTVVSTIDSSLLKKLQEINQSFCKNRTHYSFMEALIRRVKGLLRLHTGS